MGIVYYNGEMVPEEEVKIPLFDRGFLYGDGAFAVIQINEGVPLFLKEHVKQLQKHCMSFNLVMPPLESETIQQLITHNLATQGIWRLKIVVTGGESGRIVSLSVEGRSSFLWSHLLHSLSKD